MCSKLLPLCLVAAAIAPLSVAQNVVVNVESFGAVADSYNDNAPAISQALQSLHQGQTLFFPCTKGNSYNIASPLNFGRLNSVKITGGSKTGCHIDYVGTGSQPYAFSFVGAANLEISHLSFTVNGQATPPSTIFLLGRTSGSSYSGALLFTGVQVDGYATKAIVYSIGSEQNTWLEPTIILRGGGAQYAYYTSSNDDLGVYNLPSVSNLSIWMQDFVLLDLTPGNASGHALIFDAGYSSGAGNHTYRDGYFGSGSSGVGMAIYSAPGFTNWMTLTVDSIRYENGGNMFNFSGGGSYGDISITNNKADGPTPYLIYLPTACYNCKFENNAVAQGSNTSSVFGTLRNSRLSENYPFTVGAALDSFIEDRTHGTFQLSSAAASASCAASNEGTMQYLKGGNGADGVFRICQLRSGSYTWVTH